MLNLAIAVLLMSPPAATQQASQPAIQQGVTDNLFPIPSGPLVLEIPEPDSEPSVADLVRQYCALTGQNAISSQDTKNLLKQQRLHLIHSLTVPAEEVQHTFELLLRQNDFTLSILKGDGVRVIRINSLDSSERNVLRAGARYLAPEDLDTARRHPAMLFATVVTLPNTDVRQVSNSMRTMITDANTQQMLPAGNSNSMVLVGFGDSLSGLADALKTIDTAAAIGAVDRRLATEIVALENAAAVQVAGLLHGAFGLNPETPQAQGTKILGDARTNSVIIVAAAKRMAGIKDLIAALDAKK